MASLEKYSRKNYLCITVVLYSIVDKKIIFSTKILKPSFVMDALTRHLYFL